MTLETSTLSGWVGATAAALMPLVDLLRRDGIAGSAVLHGDDTPVPILAPGTGKTRTGRLWTYVRDERPYGGTRPAAAVFFASPDRKGAHPLAHLARFSGILQADGYAGFNGLYEGGRIVEAACWAHLWMPPLLQEVDRRLWQGTAAAVIYPACRGSTPVLPPLMVNPRAGTQSRVASSKLDAPSGFVRPRFARSCHHTLKDPRIRVGRWMGRCTGV